MFEKIKEILKELYLKIGCSMCCKSKCMLEIGKPDINNENT